MNEMKVILGYLLSKIISFFIHVLGRKNSFVTVPDYFHVHIRDKLMMQNKRCDSS